MEEIMEELTEEEIVTRDIPLQARKNWDDIPLQERKDKVFTAVLNGQILNKTKEIVSKRQNDCNHRKGGYISPDGKEISQGSECGEYSVIKHQFFWGDIWVICNRCGQKWKPGDPDYQEALKFPTRNQTSTSTQWKVDVNQARELTKET
jgi:hypothetical protein